MKIRSFAVLTLASCLFSSCGPKLLDVQLQIIASSCVAPSPFEGSTFLRVTVTGDKLDPLVATSEIAVPGRSVSIPSIPAGTNRQIEVRAYSKDPANGGKVISFGRSKTFDVPSSLKEGQDKLELQVMLRRVNALTPPNSLQSPSVCGRMLTARAAHSATVLSDGKVLILGGYQIQNGKKTALYKVELYDPETGTFEDIPDVGIGSQDQSFTSNPMAFHSASLLADGRVLIWGGETYASTQEPTPRARPLVYEPARRVFGQLLSEGTQIGRTRHSAVVEKNGRVLILGGMTKKAGSVDLVVEEKVEWLDASSLRGNVLAEALPRAEASAEKLMGGAFVVLAGGTDGRALRDDINFFEFNGSTFVRADTTMGPVLSQARRAAGMARFQNDNNVIVLGGYGDLLTPQGFDSTEIITNGESRKVTAGPKISPRGELCAAALPDGRVLAIGGRNLETATGGLPKTESAVEMIVPTQTGGAGVLTLDPLKVSRYQHTCTVLNDGSVLVLGGVSEAKGALTVLQDAYLFVPAPLD